MIKKLLQKMRCTEVSTAPILKKIDNDLAVIEAQQRIIGLDREEDVLIEMGTKLFKISLFVAVIVGLIAFYFIDLGCFRSGALLGLLASIILGAAFCFVSARRHPCSRKFVDETKEDEAKEDEAKEDETKEDENIGMSFMLYLEKKYNNQISDYYYANRDRDEWMVQGFRILGIASVYLVVIFLSMLI